MSLTAASKIKKEVGAKPDAFESQVADALFELEMGSNDVRVEMRELYITGAKQVEVGGGKRAVVLSVPYRLLPKFRKVHSKLVRELEKKFSGSHVVIVASRKTLPKETRQNRRKLQSRPRSRTLTAVHEAVLDDVVYPTEIVGKRKRIRLDGNPLLKVLFDRKDAATVEPRLDTFSTVYKKLTGKDVTFEFPVKDE